MKILTFAISDNFSSLSLVNSSLIFNSSLTLEKKTIIGHQYLILLTKIWIYDCQLRTSTACMEFSHFIAFNSFCHYLWSCPMVKPAPCSTSLLRFAISSFKDWIVSLALCSLSCAASTIFHAFSISYWDRSKKQEFMKNDAGMKRTPNWHNLHFIRWEDIITFCSPGNNNIILHHKIEAHTSSNKRRHSELLAQNILKKESELKKISQGYEIHVLMIQTADNSYQFCFKFITNLYGGRLFTLYLLFYVCFIHASEAV